MGLDINAVRFLISAIADGLSLDRTITIGRQGLFADPHDVTRAAASARVNIDTAAAAQVVAAGRGFCEPLLRALGAGHIDSLDISSFQDATIVHDMNQPVPDSLRCSYTAVIDGGSLEHVFNFPQAIKNCMDMVAVGGDFITSTTANNFLGHGFYQFSPELFFRVFSPDNGFELKRMVIYEEYWSEIRYYEVTDPQAVRERVTLLNRYPTYLLIRARKTAQATVFAQTPQQSDYVAEWQSFGPGEKAATQARRRDIDDGALIKTQRILSTLLPFRLRNALRERRRGPDPFNPRFYRRIDLPGGPES